VQQGTEGSYTAKEFVQTAAQKPADLALNAAETGPQPIFRPPSPLLFTEIHFNL